MMRFEQSLARSGQTFGNIKPGMPGFSVPPGGVIVAQS